MHDIALISIAVFAVGILLIGTILLAKQIGRPTKVDLVLSTIIYKNLKIEGIIMSSKLNIKEFVKGVFGIVKHDDQTPIEATFANETFVSADESIAVVVADAGDGPDTAIVDIQGVAVGETDITVEVDASYTDPITLLPVTKHKTAVIHISITAPVSDTETDLVVTLGDPQPIPDAA